jgi:phosphate transport system substrate-binding protein
MRKLKKQAYAVSPVIATLMLVLVSVGSAGAFYVWQSGWQKDVSGKAGGADLQDALTIGGSSTVYEFTAVAAPMFEAENPNFKISFQKGGSGSGVASVGTGIVDIGSASRAVKASEFSKYPDVDGITGKDIGKDLMVHTVAYDAVNGAGVTEINTTELRAMYNTTVGDADEPAWYSAATWKTYDRDDASGTEEVFVELILGLDGSELEEFTDYAANVSVGSNQDMITALGAANTIGFTSYGMAKDSSISSYIMDLNSVEPTEDSIMGVTTQYDGARPINYITIGEPSGAIKQYIDFVLGPQANQDICELCGYITLY